MKRCRRRAIPTDRRECPSAVRILNMVTSTLPDTDYGPHSTWVKMWRRVNDANIPSMKALAPKYACGSDLCAVLCCSRMWLV